MTTTQSDLGRSLAYNELIDSPLLFPNKSGKKLDHLTRRIQQLAAKCQLQLPTTTEGRHAAATAATLHCTTDERDAIAVQMSHSKRTQELHYVRTKSTAQAVKGYKLLEGLRQQSTHSACDKRVPFSKEDHLRSKVHMGLTDAQQEQYRRIAHQQGPVSPNFSRPVQVCTASGAHEPRRGVRSPNSIHSYLVEYYCYHAI